MLAPEKKSFSERKIENKDEEIVSLLTELNRQRVESEATPLEELMADLPKEIKAGILQALERQRSYGVGEDDLRREAGILMETAIVSYIDRRFNIPNQAYLRWEISRLIDEVVSDRPDTTRIDGLGVLSFDVNGLKAVNDISGHEAGNEYLKRVAAAFKDGSTTRKLQQEGVGVFIAACGGDEFSIVLKNSPDNLGADIDGSTLLEEIARQYQIEIGSIDCSDLLDFRNDEVRQKFEGFNIPDDFKFVSTVSAGSATLYEALAQFSPREDATYNDNLNALMGQVIDISDKYAQTNKEDFKTELSASADEHDRFLALLLKRNKEAMELEREKQGLLARIKELENR